jgi:hypothetical protein
MTQRSLVQRLRQHHGIEHATVTLLSRRLPGVQLMARSDLRGFIVYGNVDTATVRAAAEEALARLQAGESELALHPNCGTNLVTAGILSGLAALVAGSGRNRSFWDRLPSAVLGATLALITAIPLGRWMQRNVTTSSNVSKLRIVSVTRTKGDPVPQYRVVVGG